jgi:putative transposase
MGDRATAELVVRALSMAWRERMDRDERIVLHSDRGTQYTSEKVAKWLDEHDMVASMGAVGSSADNASAESFCGLLKRDLGNEVRSSTRRPASTTTS